MDEFNLKDFKFAIEQIWEILNWSKTQRYSSNWKNEPDISLQNILKSCLDNLFCSFGVLENINIWMKNRF
jgi:hypothetical protein